MNNEAYTVEYPVKDECQSHWRWGEITELPACRADATTARELLAIARRHLGPDAIVEIGDGLGRDVLLELVCHHCDRRERVVKPLHSLTETGARCPTCGNEREPRHTHQITGDEDFLDEPLCAIGIPPLHILPARAGDRYGFFELTGDEPQAMRVA
jgi:hypothetical protein